MIRICKRFLFAILLTPSLFLEQAQAIPIEQFVTWFSGNSQCPPYSDHDKNFDLDQLHQQYQDANEGSCKAYEFAWALGQKTSDQVWYQKAIDHLMRKKDFRRAALQSLYVERDLGLHQDIFRVYLLRAVAAAVFELGSDRTPQWIHLFLGKPVKGDDSLSQFVAVNRFFSDYPNSSFTAEIKALRESVLQVLLKREFGIAEQLGKREQFLAAVWRLEALYKDEMLDESQHLPEVVVRVIDYQLKLAREIEKPPKGVGALVDHIYQKLAPDDHYRPYKWSDFRLKNTVLAQSDGPVDRKELAGAIRQKAEQAAAILREKFPNHPATLSLKN